MNMLWREPPNIGSVLSLTTSVLLKDVQYPTAKKTVFGPLERLYTVDQLQEMLDHPPESKLSQEDLEQFCEWIQEGYEGVRVESVDSIVIG